MAETMSIKQKNKPLPVENGGGLFCRGEELVMKISV